MIDDTLIVGAQLGREPITRWRIALRCSWERPVVIANAPRASDGSPFPTLYWLTCPHLVQSVSAAETRGEVDRWADRVGDDPHLRFEVLAADQQYRAAREMEGHGDDPNADVGIAGQSDPCGTKCLHAHVAAFLAGIPDPIGRATLDGLEVECDSDDCAALLVRCRPGEDGAEGGEGEPSE